MARQLLRQGNLAEPANAVAEVLDEQVRVIDERQTQQPSVSPSTGWAAVMSVVAEASALAKEHEHRRAMQRIRDEMFELLAKEEKKRQMRDSPLFKELVSLLGANAAESITESIEKAGGSASGLHASKQAVARAAQEIATILEREAPHLNLTLKGEQLATAIEGHMGRALEQRPKMTRLASVVQPEDALATAAHNTMFALKTGDERLLELQKLRGSLGPDKFPAMVDAYDKRYGIPLVAHIANSSSLSAARLGEMVHEAKSVLTPAQRERLLEFGRAEYAQGLALLEQRRVVVDKQAIALNAEIRGTERHLANAIGRGEIADLPANLVRRTILEHLSKRFPELHGKTWEGVALRLKEIAGEKDEKKSEALIRKLVGGSAQVDVAGTRETITRTTILMQKLIALEQQSAALKAYVGGEKSEDGKLLKSFLTTVYGAEATTASSGLEALQKAAGIHVRSVDERISDPSLSSSQRERLIAERDSIDFGLTRKLVAAYLESSPPKAQEALASLSIFIGHEISSEQRRSPKYLESAKALSEAIRAAEALRQQWQGLEIPADLSNVKLAPSLTAGAQVASTHTNRIATVGAGPVTRSGAAGTDTAAIIQSQREAALSTKWFTQILDTGNPFESGIAPAFQSVSSTDSTGFAKRVDRIALLRGEMDSSNVTSRSALRALDSEPASEFLRAENLSAVGRTLSAETLKKLGVTSSLEAVERLSRELDQKQELKVDAQVLQALRGEVDPRSAVGKALAAVPSNPTDPQRELRHIKTRLPLGDLLRIDTFVARVTLARHSDQQNPAPSWAGIMAETQDGLEASLASLTVRARLARAEALLQQLSDAEHEDFLAFFESVTRQSAGRSLVSMGPTDAAWGETLSEIALSRLSTSSDLERFFSGPVPKERVERATLLRAEFEADRARKPLDLSLVEGMATSVSERYAALRVAAEAATASKQTDLVVEIAQRMRAIEAQVNGKVAQTLTAVAPTYAARQGFASLLRGTAQITLAKNQGAVGAATSQVATLARDIEALLRMSESGRDGAFNRIRQANLSEEDTLLLKALYAQQVAHAPQIGNTQPLSGDLSRDLLPQKSKNEIERTRVAKLMVGGSQALADADVETLKIAAAAQDEKRQLETLSNLRATGQFDAVKDKVTTESLAPAAQNYHKAVTSGDKVKADVADVNIKASNGDLKPADVATFVQGKNSSDFARIKEIDPNLEKTLQFSDTSYFDKAILKVLSENARERQVALEMAMLKALTDPVLFAQWLNVAQTPEAKATALRNLESLVERQPTSPKFVVGGDPQRDESKIVQYVRAQKTDYREIDAYIVNHVIVTTLNKGTSVDAATIETIRELRLQAGAQLKEIDAFLAPREATAKAAREILTMYEGTRIWAEGDPVLKGLQEPSRPLAAYVPFSDAAAEYSRQCAEVQRQRAERIAELTAKHQNLVGRGEGKLERGEFGTRFESISGKFLKDVIATTPGRIDQQTALLAPMERGVLDIHQTRELLRASFALMAKDQAEKVFGGLTPEATQSAMLLLRQRDAKITYKVTDEVEHERWVSTVSQACKNLARRDFYTSLGLTAAKIAVVVVVSAFASPVAGFAVACAFNVGDKLYRRIAEGEDWTSLGKSFAIEFGIDLLFLAVSWTKFAWVARGGKAAQQTGLNQVVVKGSAREGTLKGFGKDSMRNFFKGVKDFRISFDQFKDVVKQLPKKVAETIDSYFEKIAKQAVKKGVQNPPNWVEVTVTKSGRSAAGGVQRSDNRGAALVQSPKDAAELPKKRKAAIEAAGGFGARQKDTEDLLIAPIPKVAPKDATPPPVSPPAPQNPVVPMPITAAPAAIPVEPLVAPPPSVAAQPQQPAPATTEVPVVNPHTPPADPAASKTPPSGGAGEPKEPSQPGPKDPPAGGSGDPAMPGPKDPPSAGPKDPPAGEPPGRPIPIQPAPMQASAQGDEDGNNKRNIGAIDPAFIPPPSVVIVGDVRPVAGLHPGDRDRLGVPNPTPVQMARSGAHAQGGQSANAGASATNLDTLMAATANPRADVQAALMQSASPLAFPSPITPLQIKQASDQGFAQAQHPDSNALASRVHEQQVALQRESQLLNDTLSEELVLRARAEREARSKERLAPVEGEKLVARRSSVSTKDDVPQLKSAEVTERRVVASRETADTEAADATKGSLASDERSLAKQSEQRRQAESLAIAPEATPIADKPGVQQEQSVAKVEVSIAPVQPLAPVSTMSEARQSATPAISAAVANASGLTAPSIPLTEGQGEVVRIAGENSNDSGETGGETPSAARKRRKKTTDAQAARMRELIVQQLMSQHLTKVQREKMLRALIELGVSEQEYRALVAKLGEMEVSRLASQQSERRKFAEPLAVKHSQPNLSTGNGEAAPGGQSGPTPSQSTTNRADLYLRLKQEASARRKRA